MQRCADDIYFLRVRLTLQNKSHIRFNLFAYIPNFFLARCNQLGAFCVDEKNI